MDCRIQKLVILGCSRTHAPKTEYIFYCAVRVTRATCPRRESNTCIESAKLTIFDCNAVGGYPGILTTEAAHNYIGTGSPNSNRQCPTTFTRPVGHYSVHMYMVNVDLEHSLICQARSVAAP